MSINSQPTRLAASEGVGPVATTQTAAASPRLSSTRPARLVCLVFALLFVVIGVLGFVQGGWAFPQMAADAATTVGGLGGSPLMNFVHLILGLLALLAVIAYDIVALIAQQPGDIFGVRWPGLVLHVVGLVALVAINISSYRMRRAPGIQRSDEVRQW